MLLGSSTNVVTLHRSQGIRLKEEYHGFRCCSPPPPPSLPVHLLNLEEPAPRF